MRVPEAGVVRLPLLHSGARARFVSLGLRFLRGTLCRRSSLAARRGGKGEDAGEERLPPPLDGPAAGGSSKKEEVPVDACRLLLPESSVEGVARDVRGLQRRRRPLWFADGDGCWRRSLWLSEFKHPKRGRRPLWCKRFYGRSSGVGGSRRWVFTTQRASSHTSSIVLSAPLSVSALNTRSSLRRQHLWPDCNATSKCRRRGGRPLRGCVYRRFVRAALDPSNDDWNNRFYGRILRAAGGWRRRRRPSLRAERVAARCSWGRLWRSWDFSANCTKSGSCRRRPLRRFCLKRIRRSHGRRTLW